MEIDGQDALWSRTTTHRDAQVTNSGASNVRVRTQKTCPDCKDACLLQKLWKASKSRPEAGLDVPQISNANVCVAASREDGVIRDSNAIV